MSELGKLKVIISGGGTGGHIYPAIAIANTLKELYGDVDILFVGAEGRMEMEKVPDAGYPIKGLPIAGLQRGSFWKNIALPFKILKSILKARKIVKEFKPDVAVGVGGYASAPLLWMAGWRKVPTLLQEQNGYAGKTNKFLAKRAKKICVAYNGMEKFFPKEKIFFTGNPVRKDIATLEKSDRLEGYKHFNFSEEKKTLLILGGSLGAKTINETMAKEIDSILANGYQVLWQCGKRYYDELSKKVGEKEGLNLCAFIKKMEYAYAVADVVISRSGALSVSELCLASKPSILVPSPNVAEDHQTQNALALSTEDAAILVKDVELDQELLKEVLELLGNENKQDVLATNIKKLGRPEAAKDIAQHVVSIVKKK